MTREELRELVVEAKELEGLTARWVRGNTAPISGRVNPGCALLAELAIVVRRLAEHVEGGPAT